MAQTPAVEYQQLSSETGDEIIYGTIIGLITQRRVKEEREALAEENRNGACTVGYQCVYNSGSEGSAIGHNVALYLSNKHSDTQRNCTC